MNWFAFITEESVSPACSPGLVCLLSRVQLFRDPMNCNPPGSSIYGIDIYGIDIYGKSMGFPERNTGVGLQAVSQEFLSQRFFSRVYQAGLRQDSGTLYKSSELPLSL